MHLGAAAARLDRELVAGVGDQRRAGVGDQRQRLAPREPGERLGAGALGVVFVIGAERRGEAVVVEQAARMAGVLRQNQIDPGEDLEPAQRDVAEIADWRRDDVEPGLGRLGRVADAERQKFAWPAAHRLMSLFARASRRSAKVRLKAALALSSSPPFESGTC